MITKLAPNNGVREISITQEDEYFPPPRELRNLLTSLEAAVHVMLAVAPSCRKAARDRDVSASEVLSVLAN